MESDGDLLDGPPGGAEELHAIVDRAGRHRRRSLMGVGGLAAAVALAAGGAIGYGVSDHGSKGQTVVAGPEPATQYAGGGTAPVIGSVNPGPDNPTSAGPVPVGLSRLFTRTAGTVTIRAYQSATLPDTAVPSNCMRAGPMLQAEVSTPDVAAVVSTAALSPAAADQNILSVSPYRVGDAEGHPLELVAVRLSPAVAEVKADFTTAGTAADQMAPVQGWAVLATPVAASAPLTKGSAKNPSVPAPLGTVYALDRSGKVLAHEDIQLGGGLPRPMTGVGSSGGGTTGTAGGSVSSGTAVTVTPGSGSSSGSTGSVGSGTIGPGAVCGCYQSGSSGAPAPALICQKAGLVPPPASVTPTTPQLPAQGRPASSSAG